MALKYCIVLIEFIDEAKKLIEKRGKDFFLCDTTKVISLHPQVRVYLKSQGIPSEDTVPYLDNDAQHRIILTSEDWTKKIVGELKIKDSMGIAAAYNDVSIHHLRLHINHYLWILEILRGVCSKYNVGKIVVCKHPNLEKMFVPTAYIIDSERYLGFFAEDFCRVKNIAFEFEDILPPRDASGDKLLALCVKFMGSIIAFIDIQINAAFIRSTDKVFIVPALSYRMDLFAEQIKHRDPQAKCFMVWEGSSSFKQELYKLYLVGANIIKKLQRKNLVETVVNMDHLKIFFPRNRKDEENIDRAFEHCDQFMEQHCKNVFVYEGVLVLPYIRQKISIGLRVTLKQILHSTKIFAYVLKKLQARLLMSMYSSNIYYMMSEVANRMKVVALNISHGTHVPSNNEFEKIENYRLAGSVICNTYPYVAAQTPWTEKFLDYYQDKRQRILTGPLLFSVINQDQGNALRKEILGEAMNGKIVLHATTQKDRASLRFHITETLDEYLRAIVDIVHAVNALENVWLIIRPHPACHMTDEEFRSLLPACDRLRVMGEGSFSRILSAADLLISFSSTCIEEALQNEIPVVLYDKWKRYNHFNLKETTVNSSFTYAPAYYVSEAVVLNNIVNNILSTDKNCLVSDQNLVHYRHPKTYKENFFRFANDSLDRKVLK